VPQEPVELAAVLEIERGRSGRQRDVGGRCGLQKFLEKNGEMFDGRLERSPHAESGAAGKRGVLSQNARVQDRSIFAEEKGATSAKYEQTEQPRLKLFVCLFMILCAGDFQQRITGEKLFANGIAGLVSGIKS